ncbi:NAD(P)-dependent oxidoreductase [Paenibacillus vini]|uniref:dTDP-4-dehydrorhamnose reductase n=2 Tax=Paenibacillus vini TaxID=1476024 RepID=A0ABQ4M6I7_9BACL|nr:NAD(P)-dependent oxidoreductase [Paenibacillus vini]
MRIVVLGATGMAGHLISLFLEENGYQVYRMSRSITPSKTAKQIDATDFPALLHWLDQVEPSIIINAIGLLQNESNAQPHQAILLNSYLPHLLEHHFSKTTTRLIHLSTDCVFSGKTGGYTENSFPDGMTIYDRSKALGEVINSKDLTFRMSIIGPDIAQNASGLFHWFMKQQGKIHGFTKAIWNGVTTLELSKAIDAAIQQNLTGLYQLVPDQYINKYDLINLFKHEFNKINVEIIPYEGFISNKTLINTRSDFIFSIPSYPQMISDMSKWIQDHKELYNY